MPYLTLYTDLSPNFPFIFSFFEQIRSTAAITEEKIYIPPAPLWDYGRITSHQLLWEAVSEDKQNKKNISHAWRKWLHQLLEAAKRKQDILLFGRETNLCRQRNFLDLLRAQKELKNYTIRFMAVIGRPACLFEQSARMEWLRAWADEMSSPQMYYWAREYGKIAELPKLWHQEVGSENVTVLADTSDTAQATGLSNSHEHILHALGLSAHEQTGAIVNQLLLASREARHLLFLSNVSNNSWPSLDCSRILQTLRDLEQRERWDNRPIAHPKFRRALQVHEATTLQALESMLKTPADSLSCPQTLQADAPWEPYNLLHDDIVKSYAESLTPDLAAALRQRFVQDKDLLWQGHKRIAAELDKLHPAFSHISVEAQAPMVSVLTLAHNQEKFIGKCIESVLEQVTTFTVQHIIVDHCSSDGTADIIRRYATDYQSIRPALLTRWIPDQNVRELFTRCRSEFAALCDGDDYFSDPGKLQRQVDYLQSHPDCGLCFHPVDVIYEDGSPARVYPPEHLLPGGVRQYYTIKDLLFSNIIQTNSVMYRWRFRQGLPEWFDATLVPGDWYWHLLHAETGQIGYMRDRMSVYRRHSASLYSTAEKSHVEHRAAYGLEELRTYHICNKHFNGRYYKDFCRLATGVFADFLQLYIETDDDTLLNRGIALCPDFAKEFLQHVKV